MFTSDKDGDGKNDSNANVGGKYNHLDRATITPPFADLQMARSGQLLRLNGADNDAEMGCPFRTSKKTVKVET